MPSPAIKEQIGTKSVMYIGVKNDCLKPAWAIWSDRNHVCKGKRNERQRKAGTQSRALRGHKQCLLGFSEGSRHNCHTQRRTSLKPHLSNSSGETGEHSSGGTGEAGLSATSTCCRTPGQLPQQQPLVQHRLSRFHFFFLLQPTPHFLSPPNLLLTGALTKPNMVARCCAAPL